MPEMILPQPKDAIHKAWLYRVLGELYTDPVIANTLYFKGGTCAAMLGYLDRFSVDLDFDYMGKKSDLPKIRIHAERVFDKLGLIIHDQSNVVPQYFLKYHAPPGMRNTMKIDVTFPPPKSNQYESKCFSDIDRIITTQTVSTMMANKLVALIDRHERGGTIAGRDIYDIHYFFMRGYRYNTAVIQERTGKNLEVFFIDYIDFIEKHITLKTLDQDLNTLLPFKVFSQIRKKLKPEILMFLRDELKRINTDTPHF